MQAINAHIKTGLLSGMLLLLLSAFGTPLMAQDSTALLPGKKPTVSPHNEGKYCVMLQDGKVVVMLNEKLIDRDVVFKDGSKLTPTGDFIKKGKTTVLKNGDCVDKNGELTIHTMYTPPKIVGLETCTN
jgi:hypothetical protein